MVFLFGTVIFIYVELNQLQGYFVQIKYLILRLSINNTDV